MRVLLLWPGTDGAAAGNFGVPQLVALATYLRARTGASIDVVDLVCERALGAVSLPRVLLGEHGTGYDVVALGCYSSYDWLKCSAIAEVARRLTPRAVICAGGYHVSARPAELVADGCPFDVAIVGEGERPMARLVEEVAGGARPQGAIYGSDPIVSLDDELPPTDWSFLQRYRGVARRVASQAQLYLSRGCPFDCAFCMERAKREVSWRAFSVDRAVDEVKRLDAFLGLGDWTLYFADALFGMRTSWRRSFLEALARAEVDVEKIWLLIRVDMVEEEDLRLFARTNCGLGFGLESGDPDLLRVIRKAGRLDDYLDRMRDIATVARRYDVPWGANVIVGHPGETEATLRRSAAYLSSLFLDSGGTTGFLSVDPFRLYPGSPIDDDRGAWERQYGTRFHRPSWWHDGDPEFLSEWVDPSADLTYRRRVALTQELLAPVLEGIPQRFVYGGPARDYFGRAIADQIDLCNAPTRLHYADRYYAWNRYLGRGEVAREERRQDPDLAACCRAMREAALPAAAGMAGVPVDVVEPRRAALVEAVLLVPRERFVPLDEVLASTRDEAVALDSSGQATVSAMHAYLRAFDVLEVGEGDRVLDLGCGTGYGTAILARLVGSGGSVHGVEVDPRLAATARDNLRDLDHVEVVCGDARDASTWPAAPTLVVVGFALDEVPAAWAERLPIGARVVAPLVRGGTQRLARLKRTADDLQTELLEEVCYVRARAAPAVRAAPATGPAVEGARIETGRRALGVVS
ncbi:MAG: radical SAM protein [Polyangiaceae bacterium]